MVNRKGHNRIDLQKEEDKSNFIYFKSASRPRSKTQMFAGIIEKKAAKKILTTGKAIQHKQAKRRT